MSNRTPKAALDRLIDGNKQYITADIRSGDNIAPAVCVAGQKPYAVVLACSDSRVPPEHIFSVGLGELFVIRTAGNVVGDFERGSIEYGAEHLGAPLIVVMGHGGCGAVAAAMGGEAVGHIEMIVEEIRGAIVDNTDVNRAEHDNILNSKKRVLESGIIRHLVEIGEVEVVCAKYDIVSGEVEFF
jgi:carbonic anhydrase